MNIDGNRIQLLLTKWQYKGYRLISVDINEMGYELIAAASNLRGVKVIGENLDKAIQLLVYEVDRITEAEYENFAIRKREKLLTEIA